FVIFQATGLSFLSDLIISRNLVLSHVLILVGAWSLPGFARTRGWGVAGTCAVGGFVLLGVGTCGSLLPIIRELQPGRFVDGAAFFFIPAAVDGVARWTKGARHQGVLILALVLLLGYPAVASV